MPTIVHTVDAASKPPRPRRWIPISLRLFVAILALLGGGSVLRGISAYRQHAAIQDIELAGGYVMTVPRGPQWLRAIIAERLEWFDDAFSVDLRSSQADDVTVSHLKNLSGLKVVTLADTHLTDSGVAALADLTDLFMLDLDNTQVTDAGLAHLARLSNLVSLSLSDTAVSDAGLQHLRGLTGMRYLYLDNTLVTDAGIAELERALPNLRSGNKGNGSKVSGTFSNGSDSNSEYTYSYNSDNNVTQIDNPDVRRDTPHRPARRLEHRL